MPREKSPEIRQAILAAAFELFAEHGYADATMAAIARRAGISTANLYVYFASKLEILYEIYDPWMRARLLRLQHEVDALPTAYARVRRILETVWRDLPSEEGGFANNVMQAITTARDPKRWRPELLRWMEARLEAMISQALPPGRRRAIAGMRFGHFVVMAFDGFIVYHHLNPTAPCDDGLLDRMAGWIAGPAPRPRKSARHGKTRRRAASRRLRPLHHRPVVARAAARGLRALRPRARRPAGRRCRRGARDAGRPGRLRRPGRAPLGHAAAAHRGDLSGPRRTTHPHALPTAAGRRPRAARRRMRRAGGRRQPAAGARGGPIASRSTTANDRSSRPSRGRWPTARRSCTTRSRATSASSTTAARPDRSTRPSRARRAWRGCRSSASGSWPPRSSRARASSPGTRPTDAFELHVGTQGVSMYRDALATATGVPAERLRIVTADVGGSFGIRGAPYPEDCALVMAARWLGRPIKWVATRSESFVSDAQGRALEVDGELALDAEGRFLAIRLDWRGDLGAYHTVHGPMIDTLNTSSR
jgi:AcrR family transcriptional regulator